MTRAEDSIPGRFDPDQAAAVVAIQQRIFFYGWCIDHRRFADLDDLFLPESIVHYDTQGGTRAPWSEIREWLREALRIFSRTQHNMCNPMVAFESDPDRAVSTTYGYLVHFQEKLDGGTNVFRHSAIYRDRWLRQGGIWRILERTLSDVGVDGPPLFEGVRVHYQPQDDAKTA